MPSPTSLSPDSSHAPSLTSLPPELVSQIFETLFYNYPVRKRKADLASLCLVNKAIRIIAQPLLFRDFHLDYRKRYIELPPSSDTPFYGDGKCADFVRSLKISFDEKRFDGIEHDAFDLMQVLPSMKNLHTVRSGWSRSAMLFNLTPKLVIVFQSSIRRFEIPNTLLTILDLDRISRHLPHLETLIASLPQLDPSESCELSPVFHLRRLVITDLPNPLVLPVLLRSSITFLQSLSFTLPSTDFFPPLSDLVNLESISLVVSLSTYIGRLLSPDESKAKDTRLVSNLVSVLKSIRQLPIQRIALSLSADSDLFDFDSVVLHGLPPSTTSFIVGPYNDECIDWPSLFPRNGPLPYPNLKYLSVARLAPDSFPTRLVFLNLGIEKLYERYGVQLERPAVTDLDRFNAFVLDPNRVERGDYEDDIKMRDDYETEYHWALLNRGIDRNGT